MQHWQLPFLGLHEFPADLTEFEIRYFFTFTPRERQAIVSRDGDHHRLAAAVHMGFIKMTGRTLDALDTLPVRVLRHLSTDLGLQIPELTTLRALYGRSQTLLDHQGWAAQLLGFRPFTERRQRVLVMHVRREAHHAVTLNRLVEFSRRWLYEQRILILADRRLRDLARRAYVDTEQAMHDAIHRDIPPHVLDEWRAALFLPRRGHDSTLEWLQQGPRRKLKGLREQLEKVRFLLSLQVETYPLDDIRLERQRSYARQMRRRRPARLRALTEPRRTLEMVCFLRIPLLQNTDVVLSMADRLIQDLHARTTRDVQEAEWRGSRSVRQSWHAIHRVLSDPTIPDGMLRQEILALMPSAHTFFPSRAAAIRGKLSEHARHVRPLVKMLVELAFEGEAHAPLLMALSELRALYARRARQLPADIDARMAPRWAELIGGIDRQRALRAFEAATLFALRKALRNGAIWVAHSLAYRRRTAMLIPDAEWERHRQRFCQQLGVPLQASSYTPQLLANLEAGLTSLAEAVEAGEVGVDDRGVHLQALEAAEVPPDLESTKQALFQEVGRVQLPALLMAIDHETRFSWRLPGHAPTTDTELLTVYAAVLAHGTELDVAGVALMMPALSEATIAEAMRRLEDEAVWRDANAAVLEFLHRHAVVKAWGEAFWGRFLGNWIEGPWPDNPPWVILRVSMNPSNPRRATMSSHSRILEWTAMIRIHLPALSKPQATVLALWSLGMVLARSSALTAVAAFLAMWLRRQEQTVRQQLREWCYEAEAKRGDQRQAVDPQACFVPLLQWIVGQWQGTQLALALDATTLGTRFTVLAISVVYRGCAMPVAWTILPANQPHAWRREWLRLLRMLRPAIPTSWTVIVLADRGLYAGWLFRRIVRLGWHPFLRINAGGTFRPTGYGRFYPLATFAPHVGSCWRGTGSAFQRAPRQLPCTLLACWEEGYAAPWLILTDLPPEASDACWYGLRAWIEQGFKVTKRAGWQWQRTRMTEPQRAARLWLAVAVATLWLLSVGGMADAAIPDSTLLDVSAALSGQRRQRRATRLRLVSAFRRGWALILVALLDHEPLPLGTFLPEPWPMVSLIDATSMVHDSGVLYDVAA